MKPLGTITGLLASIAITHFSNLKSMKLSAFIVTGRDISSHLLASFIIEI